MNSQGKETTADFNKLPYTIDPYGYVRRKTRTVMVGEVAIGGDNPICVQSTLTSNVLDTQTTVAEILQLVNLGCQIIRINLPTQKHAEKLKNIRAELEANEVRVSLIAEVGFNPGIMLEAARWADEVCISYSSFVTVNQFARISSKDGEYEAELKYVEEKFALLIQSCKELGHNIEININLDTFSKLTTNLSMGTTEEIVQILLEIATIAHKYNYQDLIFSIKANSIVTTIHSYRLLVARLDELRLDYPIHLISSGIGNNEIERVKSAVNIGSLLEDGIGDSIQVSLSKDPQQEIETAFRIARRYTPIHFSRLQKAGIEDELFLVVAADRANHLQPAKDIPEDEVGKKLAYYPFVIANLPDYRDFYHYNRRQSNVVQVGNVKVGGNNPRPVLSMLTTQLTQLKKAKSGLLDNNLPGMMLPDIFVVNELSPEIKQLKTSKILDLPIVVVVQSPEEAWQAVNSEADAILFCLDLVGQIGGELSELESILEVMAKPELKTLPSLPLFIISTHNAGQSWGSYDYWPWFSEAYQSVEAVELCYNYGVTNLVLGIYTYNSAWNIQNNRLLATLLQERGWTPPIHLIAPDIYGEEDDCLIDGSISLGSLLADGFGDSIQLDYLPKVSYQPERALNSFQKTQLALNILQQLEL